MKMMCTVYVKKKVRDKKDQLDMTTETVPGNNFNTETMDLPSLTDASILHSHGI